MIPYENLECSFTWTLSKVKPHSVNHITMKKASLDVHT